MTSQLNDVRCYFSEFSCLIWIKFVCFNYVASVSPVLMFGFLFFHEGYGYALVCGLVFFSRYFSEYYFELFLPCNNKIMVKQSGIRKLHMSPIIFYYYNTT